MTKKDLWFLSFWSALLLTLIAPALIRPHRALFNFGDLYLYHYPLRELAHSALESGRMPFWNPYIFSGLPLAANSQAVLFYPPDVLGRFFPLLKSFSLGSLLHLWWAGLGLALLGRAQGLKSGPAWLLGFCYGLSPFLIYRVAEGIPTLLAALSWAPWAWLAWTAADLRLLSAVFALQFFSGHAQFMILNALAMGVAACVLSPHAETNGAWRGRFHNLSVLIFAALAAAALCLVQWPLTLEFLAHSTRRHWSAIYSLGYSLNAKEILDWICPGLFASPGSAPRSPVSVFLETSAAFPGLAVLFFAALGIKKGPRTLPAVLIASGVFLGLGKHDYVYPWLLSRTPLGFLRTPARFSFLSFIGFFLAAGLALKRPEKFKNVFSALFAISLFQLVLWDGAFIKAQDARPSLQPRPDFARALANRPLRVLTDAAIQDPDKTMMYHAMNVNGYDAFYLEGYPLWAFESEGRAAMDASRGYLEKWDTPQMRALGVGYVLSPSGLLRKVPGAWPLAYFTDRSGRVLGDFTRLEILNPEHWRISGSWASRDDFLTLSQPYYPGWRAYLNGRRVPLSPWRGFLQSVARPDQKAARSRPEAERPVSPWEARRLAGTRSRTAPDFSLDLIFRPTAWNFLTLGSVLAWGVWLWMMRCLV